MPSVWFIVPAHGRAALARICLRQLRRTCDALEQEGVEATAVVVADDENRDTARELGFATVHRDNRFLSRKFNDGIQLALDPELNPRPADYIIPCGSDDWVDHRLFLDLPEQDTMVGFPRLAVVSEDGRSLTCRTLPRAGSGIRIYPAGLIRALQYRPADEDRRRGCDGSIYTNLVRRHHGAMKVETRHLHDYQIVDWKSWGEQMNSYRSLVIYRGSEPLDPFVALAGVYPSEALEEMEAHYMRQREQVPA